DSLKESEEEFRTFFENEPEYCYMVSTEGIMLDVNKAALKTLGYKKRELVGKHVSTIYAPESLPKMEQLLKIWRKSGSLSNEELNILTKKGEVRTVLLSVSAEKDKDGKIIRSISVQKDITEQRKAERIRSAVYKISEAAITADDLENFYLSIHGCIGELMPAENMYIALYDSSSDRISFPYFVDEYDEKPDPIKSGKGLTEYVLLSGEPLLATPEVFEDLVVNGKVEDRGTVSVDWLGVPLKTKEMTIGVMVVQSYKNDVRFREEDKNLLMFVSTQIAMVIERVRSNLQIRKDLKEKEIMIKEIHHRVKNNLQIMSSLLNLQSAKIDDERISMILNESKSRIQSMSIIHEMMYQKQNFAQLDMKYYINKLIFSLTQLYSFDTERINIIKKYRNVRLDLNRAIPCGMIMNELISNAMKHAFPGKRKGEIEIKLQKKS
ncbi:PAS domain S-box protein, partial [bacterium]|nr:PAS domain S-box protein [bacterium]